MKFLSCTGYPACKSAVWFPDTVLEVRRDDSVCPTCRPHPVHMLKLKFRRGSLPPMMPLEFVGCIGGCDETLREVLNLKYLRPGGGGGGGGQGSQSSYNAPRQQSQPRANPGPRPRAGSSRPPPWAETGRPSAPPPPAPVWSSEPPAAVQNDATVCNCGQDALLLTVRKEGPNQGRQFYKCNSGNCNFFLWADQPNDQGTRQTTGRNQPPRPTPQPPRPSLGFGNTNTNQRFGSGGSGGGNGDVTMCNCNEPAVSRTVMKDGANKGRMFHTCGKPREQQCDFFQWAESENVPPPVSRGFNSGETERRGRKTGPPTKAPGAKRPRTCGTCHQPGHTRTTCPQNN